MLSIELEEKLDDPVQIVLYKAVSRAGLLLKAQPALLTHMLEQQLIGIHVGLDTLISIFAHLGEDLPSFLVLI